MTFQRNLRDWLYWRLYPGLNLHARLRYRLLPQYFEEGVNGNDFLVLDAGCGNGMLSYRSYLLGGRVVGVSIKRSEVEKARRLFNGYRGIPESRLRFQEGNLYSLDYAENHFDAIICTEVLEHLRRDRDVCRVFHRILKPGGIVHICAPNAEHPYNKSFPLDREESGGHVRPGYTEESYRALLEPLGFEIETVVGLGGPFRQAFNRRIKEIQARFGASAGLPLFLLALAVLPFERAHHLPNPFSIYVKARKALEKT